MVSQCSYAHTNLFPIFPSLFHHAPLKSFILYCIHFSISGIVIIIYGIYYHVSSMSILLSRAIITFCIKFLQASRVLTLYLTCIFKLVDFT